MSNPIELYYMSGSPPCAAVFMAADFMGIKFNLHELEWLKNQNMTPEYLKMNPQHCVPTIVDNDFTLWESRAIMQYLVGKFAKTEEHKNLYPTDLQKRATIDRLLQFDLGLLYIRLGEYLFPLVMSGGTVNNEEKLKSFKDALNILETFIGNNEYVTGKNITLADFSIMASVTTTEVIDFDFNPWPNTKAWMDRMKKLPNYHESVQKGMDYFKQYYHSLQKK